MRIAGLGLSAVLIAAGAILAWAVSYDAEGVDLNQVGVILFVVGVGVGVISLLAAAAGSRRTVESRRDAVVDGRPVVEEQTQTVHEHGAT